jgi:hypothetical protein
LLLAYTMNHALDQSKYMHSVWHVHWHVWSHVLCLMWLCARAILDMSVEIGKHTEEMCKMSPKSPCSHNLTHQNKVPPTKKILIS